MATFVVEVVCADDALRARLETVIAWICDAQSAFQIELLKLSGKSREALASTTRGGILRTRDAYAWIRQHIREIGGTHQRVVVVTPDQVDGDRLGRLFSSMDSDQDRLTGHAVVSTYQVGELLEGRPLEGYLIQQLVSISLRSVLARPMLHEDEPKDCLFHKRTDRRLIALTVLDMRLCDRCRDQATKPQAKDTAASNFLDRDQWQSLRDLMHPVSRAMNSEDPDSEISSLLSQRQGKYSPLAIRDRSRTLPMDVIQWWREFRRGKARWTISLVLILGGLAVMDPPWWQALLEDMIGLASDREPSALQSVLGFCVVLLGFLAPILLKKSASEQG